MIEIKRIIPTAKLTQARLEDLRQDEILVAHCSPNANEWKTAERIAYNVRRNFTRPDGMTYDIKSISSEMKVEVKLVPICQ